MNIDEDGVTSDLSSSNEYLSCDEGSESSASESDQYTECQFSDLPVILEEAHPLAVKLDSLIKQSKVPENRILYKFLNDTLSILINPRHKYDDDVLEFFNTIQHLGGKATVNFLGGPMGHGQGRGTFTSTKDIKLNLGGPSEPTRNKKKKVATQSAMV